ncbi:MAG TPA: nucleotide exchange factor GrpE [Acidimicrobiales bacterium]|nr:nucleotide exchange factor GrpE [Acidimicrobiales bacterium]
MDRWPAPSASAAGSEEDPASTEEVDALVEQAEEALEADLEELADVDPVAAERDDYLNRLKHVQADFANYRKRMIKQQAEHEERATEGLVTKLLPVLDNFDLALGHGAEDLMPVHRSLLEVLEAAGLSRIDPAGQPFDPNEHDAVQHEAGEGEPEVVEVHRAGYRWKGRVLRPAMVKVKG